MRPFFTVSAAPTTPRPSTNFPLTRTQSLLATPCAGPAGGAWGAPTRIGRPAIATAPPRAPLISSRRVRPPRLFLDDMRGNSARNGDREQFVNAYESELSEALKGSYMRDDTFRQTIESIAAFE